MKYLIDMKTGLDGRLFGRTGRILKCIPELFRSGQVGQHTYNAIDNGVKVAPNLQPDQGHWVVAIWGIAGMKTMCSSTTRAAAIWEQVRRKCRTHSHTRAY